MIHYQRDDVRWSATVRDMTFGDYERALKMADRELIPFLVLEVRRDNESVDGYDDVPMQVLLAACSEAWRLTRAPLAKIGENTEKSEDI